MKNKGRVIVGMSGGVDSSVAAALLKEQGYDVIGVYILGWTGTAEFPCHWQSEEADARQVAEQLKIPFYTINLSKEYEEAVINDFFAAYRAGVTPNPDILCNREIKFKALWQAVRQFEPDFLATGHYAKKLDIRNSKFATNIMAKAVDTNKDQTYFLWGINKELLPQVLFPLGGLQKSAVRALAKKFGLATASKKDSQGICFVGPLKVRQFLQSQLKAIAGPTVLPDGRFIATHQGAALYTIGQRLDAGSVEWTGDIPPLFVIAKDVKKNLVVVGTESQTYATELIATQANWFTAEPTAQFAAVAKIRYRQEDVAVSVRPDRAGWRVSFAQPVRAITPGQSIVFYTPNGQLMGGAIIKSVPEQEKILQKLDGQPIKTP